MAKNMLLAEVKRLRADMNMLRAQARRHFHTRGCTTVDQHGPKHWFVANCCEGNDAALLGLRHWDQARLFSRALDLAVNAVNATVAGRSSVLKVTREKLIRAARKL